MKFNYSRRRVGLCGSSGAKFMSFLCARESTFATIAKLKYGLFCSRVPRAECERMLSSRARQRTNAWQSSNPLLLS